MNALNPVMEEDNQIIQKLISEIRHNYDDLTYDELIEEAMEDEREGYLLYIRLSKKMKNKKTKEAFKILAIDELAHLEMLEKFVNEGPMSLKIPRVEYKGEIVVKEVPLDSEADLEDVLNFAINEEKKAIIRYRNLAMRAASPQIHDIFVELSRFELSHLVRLENIYKTNYYH